MLRAQLLLLFVPFLARGVQESSADIGTRAAQRMERGDYVGAAEVLRPYLRRSPGHPDLWNLLGICESESNHTDAAREAFESGLRLDPGSVGLHENLGFLYFRNENYAQARKYLSDAISLGSDKPGVAFSLAASRIRTGEREAGLAQLKELEPGLSREPSYWTERGWAELRDSAAAASESFDRALALAPDDLRALNGAASAAEASHEDERALSYLVRAKKAGPDDLRTLLHFGSVCLRRDLTIDALDAIEHAYKLAPSNNLALFLYARVQIAFQHWQESHDRFTDFDRRVPNYAPAQYALGWLDTKLNRPAEARAHLERSVALDPGQLDAAVELAVLDLNEGRLDAAEARLRAVLSKQARHSKAAVALGDVLLRRGDLQGARSQYEAAIDSDPKSGPAHYKLSTVLQRMGDTDRAGQERQLGANLNAEELRAGKTVLMLSDPEGNLLSGIKTKGEQ